MVRPVPLPGLELRNGVPESLRTLVAVPTLLTTPEDIAEQVERLGSIIWPVQKAICTLLCYRIGSTRMATERRAMRSWSLSHATALSASIDVTASRRGPALSPAAPSAGLERKRKALDWLGAETRRTS